MTKSMEKAANKLAFYFLILVFFVSTILFAYLYFINYLRANPAKFVDGNKLFIHDFTFYAEMARAFWFTEFKQVYNLETVRAFFSSDIGIQFNTALPVNILPPAILLLLPLIAICNGSLALQQALFIGLSITTLFYALGRYFIFNRVNRRYFTFLWMLLVSSCLISGATLDCILIGQSSILLTGITLYIFQSNFEQISTGSKKTSLLLYFGMLVATIKPHYLFINAIILLSAKKIKILFISLLSLVGISLLLTPALGWDWPIRYIESSFLTHLQVIPFGLFKDKFANNQPLFGNVFSGSMGGLKANLLGTILCLTGIVIINIRRYSENNQSNSYQYLINSLFTISLLSAFSPYFPPYDEILVSLVFIVSGTILLRRNDLLCFYIILVLSHITLNYQLYSSFGLLSFWLIKILSFSFCFNKLRNVQSFGI